MRLSSDECDRPRQESPDGHTGQMNRLATETSPYLLQHADNPVDWYPWGDEAFTRAREEDKPILLSHRLLGVSLVPRDGARVVRGRGDRGSS